MARKKKAPAPAPKGYRTVIRGDRLRALRLKAGKTQVRLAFEANAVPYQIVRIESGKADPRLDLFARICRALDCDPAYLLGLDAD